MVYELNQHAANLKFEYWFRGRNKNKFFCLQTKFIWDCKSLASVSYIQKFGKPHSNITKSIKRDNNQSESNIWKVKWMLFIRLVKFAAHLFFWGGGGEKYTCCPQTITPLLTPPPQPNFGQRRWLTTPWFFFSFSFFFLICKDIFVLLKIF